MADDVITDNTSPQDAVYADFWNPPSNRWSPSDEPHDVFGRAEPSHGDAFTADPMVNDPGDPRTVGAGTAPDVRKNLLTDVRDQIAGMGFTIEHHHVVETSEQGAEGISVKVVLVQGNLSPTALLEENPRRKRAFLRIVPNTPTQTTNATEQAPANPATGANGVLTVPTGQTWLLNSLAFVLTTSAIVANRQVQVTIADPTGRIMFQFLDGTALTASQIGDVSLAPGLPTTHTLLTGATFNITGPMPALTLPANSTITITAVGLQASDQISNIVAMTTVTTGTAATPANDGVWINARASGGAPAATSAWFKMIQGDGPLELKTQDGVDGICSTTAGSVLVQVYEELYGVAGEPGVAVS